MSRAYYDTAYLVKLYCREVDTDAVLMHLRSISIITTSLHGWGELASTLHRKRREGAMSLDEVHEALEQFHDDVTDGLVELCEVTPAILNRMEQTYLKAPADIFLRAADALHLACAAENGFTEVYSNDRQFLAAAPLFGLRGVNVISA